MDTGVVNELHDLVEEEIPSPHIKVWLQGIGDTALKHMHECAIDEQGTDEYDKALLTVEEGYMFLLGVALKNKWLPQETLH